MSLQVGGFCYATPVEAGAAACAAFVPVSALSADGANFRTVSCNGADPGTGALKLTVSTTEIASNVTTVAEVQQQIAFTGCIEQVKWDAYLGLFGAILTAAVVVWASWKVVSFLNSNTRIAE